MTNSITNKVAEILIDNGWVHKGDAQWERLESALPDIAAILSTPAPVSGEDWEARHKLQRTEIAELRQIAKFARNYLDASKPYISDSDFFQDGHVANAEGDLHVALYGYETAIKQDSSLPSAPKGGE